MFEKRPSCDEIDGFTDGFDFYSVDGNLFQKKREIKSETVSSSSPAETANFH